MQKIEEFSDERNKSWCIHCGGFLSEMECNEDHVPTKGLLLKPRPHNLPVVGICKKCNSGFSLDEQYFVAFLSSVLCGSTNPQAQGNPSASRALQSEKLRARIEKSKTTYMTKGGERKVIWKPEVERIERVLLKNARGHAYFEYGEPKLDKPEYVRFCPIAALTPDEYNEFEGVVYAPTFAAWPEVGSRMMTRLLTGQDMDGPWVVVQKDKYRYRVIQENGVTVRCVLWEYLAAEIHWGS
ncbi:MAG: hypothetical protein PHW76_04590 [Alphaproteobacteria bacterium]|nr:hypothetical protein [Alphaproteobacteria bacterium]